MEFRVSCNSSGTASTFPGPSSVTRDKCTRNKRKFRQEASLPNQVHSDENIPDLNCASTSNVVDEVENCCCEARSVDSVITNCNSSNSVEKDHDSVASEGNFNSEAAKFYQQHLKLMRWFRCREGKKEYGSVHSHECIPEGDEGQKTALGSKDGEEYYELDEASWDDSTEVELAELMLKSLDSLYREAISKIIVYGYSEDEVLRAVLKQGRYYSGKDAISSIVENALAYLTGNHHSSDESISETFSDIEELQKFRLTEMVSVLREIRPSLSKGDAMWCLLMCDMNVALACAVEDATAVIAPANQEIATTPAQSMIATVKLSPSSSSLSSFPVTCSEPARSSSASSSPPRTSQASASTSSFPVTCSKPSRSSSASSSPPLTSQASASTSVTRPSTLTSPLLPRGTDKLNEYISAFRAGMLAAQSVALESGLLGNDKSVMKQEPEDKSDSGEPDCFNPVKIKEVANLTERSGETPPSFERNPVSVSNTPVQKLTDIALPSDYDEVAECQQSLQNLQEVTNDTRGCISTKVVQSGQYKQELDNCAVESSCTSSELRLVSEGLVEDKPADDSECVLGLQQTGISCQDIEGVSGAMSTISVEIAGEGQDVAGGGAEEGTNPVDSGCFSSATVALEDERGEDCKLATDEQAMIAFLDSIGTRVDPTELERGRCQDIQSLLRRLRDLEIQLQERTEWAKQKVMQAARRLSKDLAELKALRLEREEAVRLKKDKQASEESQLKKSTDLENALKKASSQVDRANAAVRKLEADLAEVRAEMEATKLSASESLSQCQELVKREKKYLKRAQAWDKQKAKLQEDLTDERRKIVQLQQQIVQAKERQTQAEVRWRQEEKAKEEANYRADSEKRAREQAEANAKRREDSMRRKAESTYQRHRDDIQRLETEIMQLKNTAEATQLATSRWGPGVAASPHLMELHSLQALKEVNLRLSRELAEYQDMSRRDVRRERECVMCMCEEMSVVFLPCAHQIVCIKCNELHEKQGMRDCPSCRTPIQQRMRVYGVSS